jgi:hypothetical protein
MPTVARRKSQAERDTTREKIAPTIARVIGRDGPKRQPFKPTVVKPNGLAALRGDAMNTALGAAGGTAADINLLCCVCLDLSAPLQPPLR